MTTHILKTELERNGIKSLKDTESITIDIENPKSNYEDYIDKISEGKFIVYNKELLYVDYVLDSTTYIKEDEKDVDKGVLFPAHTIRITNPEVYENISVECYVVDITFSTPYFHKSRRNIKIYKGKYQEDPGLLDGDEESLLRDSINRIYSSDSSDLEKDNFTYESYRDGIKRIVNLI